MSDNTVDLEARRTASLTRSDLGPALMARLGAIYGSRWMAQFSNERVSHLIRAEWSNVASCLSREEIERGVKRCVAALDWPPSVPEFLRLALDIPDQALAGRRAVKGTDLDPVSALIRELVGARALGDMTEERAHAAARGMYQSAREQIVAKRLAQEAA